MNVYIFLFFYCPVSNLTNNLMKFIIYLFIFTVVQVQLSPFVPLHFPHPTHPHLPPLILTPFGFVHVSFVHVPWYILKNE